MSILNQRATIVASLLVMLIAAATPCHAATAAEVDAALNKGIEFLYSKQQQSTGSFEKVDAPEQPLRYDSPDSGQWGGMTGIATYALLAAEQDPHDPRIGKAVDFLQTVKMRGTYAISARAQVWPFMARVRKVKEFAKIDADLLLNGAKIKGPGKGLWYYYIDETKDERTDHSASQFAILGIWACEEAGVEIPSSFWQTEDALWRRDQQPTGGWQYVYMDHGGWGRTFTSMTLAGLASLYITQEKTVTVASRCQPLPADGVIDHGIGYVASHYPDDFGSPPDDTWVYGAGPRTTYFLFGLSRLGLAGGLRYIGTHDWFATGSDYLVKAQKPDGSWGNTWETSFAVLFLARGRAPVAFNKLQYDTVGTPPLQTWNVRPRDVANLADWMGKSLERRINWQVVDIKTNPDDWLDAPILYVSGSDELKVSADEAAKLHRFVEDGGLILGNADCGSGKFTASFRKLGQQLFPNYEFAELPANHSVYTREQFLRTKWKSKPRVLSMSNGVRELMMLCPDADLGRAYATQSDRSKPEDYQLGVDLCEYMVGLDLRNRGDSIIITPDPAIIAAKKIKVARLKYTGNWDPEPGGWRRIAAVLHNRDKLDLSVGTVNLGATLDGFKLAHLTGTAAVKLTAAQKSALTDFVNAGGTLLVDSTGGGSDFSLSMEQQLNEIFGQPLSVLPPAAPLYQLGDSPLTTFTYSRFARTTFGNLKAPRLKAITLKDRVAVLFSGDDLSLGIVGQSIDAVVGYAPETATEIVRRVALLAAK